VHVRARAGGPTQVDTCTYQHVQRIREPRGGRESEKKLPTALLKPNGNILRSHGVGTHARTHARAHARARARACPRTHVRVCVCVGAHKHKDTNARTREPG